MEKYFYRVVILLYLASKVYLHLKIIEFKQIKTFYSKLAKAFSNTINYIPTFLSYHII